jgi:hypothetical protein
MKASCELICFIVLFLSFTTALYSDQVGVLDVHSHNVGVIDSAVLANNKLLIKTDLGVLALINAIDGRTGEYIVLHI